MRFDRSGEEKLHIGITVKGVIPRRNAIEPFGFKHFSEILYHKNKLMSCFFCHPRKNTKKPSVSRGFYF